MDTTQPAAEAPPSRPPRSLDPKTALLLLLCLALCALAVLCCVQARRLSMETGRLKDAQLTILHQEQALQDAQDLLEAAWADKDALQDALAPADAFWSSHAVVVTQAGDKYHRWDCSALRPGAQCMVLNPEAAQALGSAPCSLCDPPAPTSAASYFILDP